MYDYNRDLVSIIVIHTCLLLKNVQEKTGITPEKRVLSGVNRYV